MAYGTVANVASLTRVYTNAGLYDPSTNPTESAVSNFLTQISGMVDVALAGQGFSVPVTQASAKAAIDGLVEALAADLCHAANTSGRFFTERALTAGVNPMVVVRKDVLSWVESNVAGLEQMGVTRTLSAASNMSTWISPERQR